MLFFYQQFVDDLPVVFEEFLTEFQKLFPIVYDTKCMGTTLAFTSKTDLNTMAG